MKQEKWAANLQKAMTDVALTIFSLDDMEKWPGWVIYLLEKLEELDANSEPADVDYGPGDVNFEWVLEQVKDSIDARLEGGSW